MKTELGKKIAKIAGSVENTLVEIKKLLKDLDEMSNGAKDKPGNEDKT